MNNMIADGSKCYEKKKNKDWQGWDGWIVSYLTQMLKKGLREKVLVLSE